MTDRPADQPRVAAVPPDTPPQSVAEILVTLNDRDWAMAKLFHETYERLAPTFGYRTREESAKPWEQVPHANAQLMAATVHEVMSAVDGILEPLSRRDQEFLLEALANPGKPNARLRSAAAAAPSGLPEPPPVQEYPPCSWPEKPHAPRYEPNLGNTYCSKCGKWLPADHLADAGKMIPADVREQEKRKVEFMRGLEQILRKKCGVGGLAWVKYKDAIAALFDAALAGEKPAPPESAKTNG